MKTNLKDHSKKIRVADYITNFLVKIGVRDIFVLTGFGAMYLNDAIARNKKIRYFCVRNEAASPMMAEAYARVKEGLGAVCLTAGPGSTNAVPGLAEAFVDAAPIIVISGQVNKNQTTYNAKVEGLRSFGTAEINIVPIVRPLTKFVEMVNDENLIRYYLEKAVFLAKNGRPGPVWLDIPHDVQNAIIEPKRLKGFNSKELKLEKDVADLKIEQVLDLLRKSKRPLIVAGNGIHQGRAASEFYRFITKLKIPVILSRLGLDLLPYSHPFNMGLGGIKGVRFCGRIMKKADFVLVLGSRLSVPFIGPKMDVFVKSAKIVVVDIEKAELLKPGIRIDLAIHANVLVFLKEINKRISKSRLPFYSNWLKNCQDLKQKNPMVLASMKRNPIDLYYFMSKLDEASGKNNILVTDAGSNYYVGGQVFRFERGQKEVTSATFAAMGLSIPLAIGAAIAKRNAQILAVTGDGSLELNIQELKTISYYNLNIKLFVINNGGYVSMRNWQDTFFEGRYIGSDNKTGAETLNLKNVAKAFDLKYELISDWKKIDRKINQLMRGQGPIFIEVICSNRQEIVEPIKDES